MSRPTPFWKQTARWGVAAGAAAGTVIGGLTAASAFPAIAAEGRPAVLLLGLVFGLVFGTAIAVLPSLVGAAVVTAVLRSRHPHPASEDSVRRDLGVLFGTMVGVLDVLLAIAIALYSEDLSSVAVSSAFLLAANAIVAAVLCPARTRLARTWSET